MRSSRRARITDRARRGAYPGHRIGIDEKAVAQCIAAERALDLETEAAAAAKRLEADYPHLLLTKIADNGGIDLDKIYAPKDV